MAILPSDETARFGVLLGSIIALIAALTLAYFVDLENQNFKWIIVIFGTLQTFLIVLLIILSIRTRIAFKDRCPSKMLVNLRSTMNVDESVKRISGTFVSKTWQIEEYSDEEDDNDEKENEPSEIGLNFIGTLYPNT